MLAGRLQACGCGVKIKPWGKPHKLCSWMDTIKTNQHITSLPRSSNADRVLGQ